MNTKNVIEIAIECGAVIDVLCMGRHDNVVFTSGEIQRFVQRIEQPYVDTIEDLHDEIGRLRAVLTELDESSEYWSEYDVPLGIVERIKSALAKARGEL